MMVRRRPIARAAIVGGAGYAAGRHATNTSAREADQAERIDALEAQQYAQPPAAAPAAPAPAAGGMSEDTIQKLKELAQLKDSGVLTEAEFDAQKQKLLG